MVGPLRAAGAYPAVDYRAGVERIYRSAATVMNIVIDDTIYHLQQSGGISTLWRALTPALQAALPDFTFDPARPADVFISTYYQPAPDGAKSIAVVYDYIH